MIILSSIIVSRATLLALFACGTLALSGCGGKHPINAVPQSTTAEKAVADLEVARLKQCQKELEALKGINPEQHQKFLQSFNRLMSGTAQYGSLRNLVNAQTKETVDALYRYKVNRLCANITQTTLTELAGRGEALE
jgi:hypothetical protein